MSTTEIHLGSLASEIQNGRGISLSAAAKLVPGSRSNSTADTSTLTRWIVTGCRTADGRTVRLEALRVGSRWVTSREALARFAEALTSPPPDGTSPTTPQPTPAARRKAVSDAERRLQQSGA